MVGRNRVSEFKRQPVPEKRPALKPPKGMEKGEVKLFVEWSKLPDLFDKNIEYFTWQHLGLIGEIARTHWPFLPEDVRTILLYDSWVEHHKRESLMDDEDDEEDEEADDD